MSNIKKNQINRENKESKIQKDELMEKSQLENHKKEEINKIINKEYLNVEQNSKGIKNNNIEIKVNRIYSDSNIRKTMTHKSEKNYINNKINKVMTNTINSDKACKLKFKEKLEKKEEENMILKMNKSNNFNSLIEEYQTKFTKCKINILKIEELIQIISSKLNEINYIGKFYISFNELKQKIEETKALLNKEETNETNECLKYDKNLFEVQGIKLEEIENKNKTLNKTTEDELKNMINTLEKEKNEKDNKIKLLEKNIDEINNKLEKKEKELKEIKLLNEKIKQNEEKIKSENNILQKEKEKLKVSYEDKEKKNNIYLAEKLKCIKNKENLIKKEMGEINLIKYQLRKCFEDIKKI